MIYDYTNTHFTKMLKNLSAILDKAAAHADTKKFDMDVLLTARLSPDQFAFMKQIQIVCDTAKLGAARLTGKDAPVHEDNEKTVADAKARIESVIKYLGTFSAKDYVGAEERTVSQPRWQGKTLTGKQYAEHHVVPNFYFHMTTAYAILRHNGVDVGKKDYLGPLPFKE